MKFSRQLFSSVIIVRTLIASLLAMPSIQAQQTITYSDGENNSSAIVITSATDPTTVELSSGSATQSGIISDSGATGNVDVDAGSGTLTFDADNTYTGDTAVHFGTLSVTGTGAAIGTAHSTTYVGYYGGDDGSLVISQGGTVTDTSGYIADNYDSNGSVTVTGTGSSWFTQALDVGNASTGMLLVSSGGQVTSEIGYIGYGSVGQGSVTVTGTGTMWTSSSAIVVGLQGTGTLTVSNDGTVSSPSVYLAYENYPSLNVASQGTVNLDSGGALQTGQIINYEGGIGTGAEFNFDGGILRATANSSDFISGFSPGQVTLQGDGGTIDDNGYNVTISAPISGSGGLTAIGAGTTTLTGNNTYSGNTTIDSGTLAVSGTAAAINSPSSLVYVGNASGDNGTFVISNGARVTDAYGELGSSANSIGTATVTGMNGSASSTWTNSAYIDVGVYGTGTLNIEDGAQVSAYGTYVSDESSGQGTVTVTGVGANGTPSTLNNSEFTFVGEGGPGTLAIENGGYVVDQNAEIGWAGQGTVTVTGVNGGIASTWNNTGNLYVGFYNQGTLNVADGGVVEVDGGSGTITLAYEPNGTGTLNIGNGGLAGTIEAAQVTGMAGASEVEFDETDKSYTFAPTLTGNLKVVQAGTGTTVLTGTNTYTGGTNVRTGSLVAASSGALGSGPVTVSGGMLSSTSGIGAIVGGELSLSSGSIALTSSPIPTFQLALNQNFDMTGGTLSLTFSLGTVGSISSLGGDFTLNGGTLNLNDSFTSPADYALTYVVLSGFGSGSVSGLSIIGYDTVDYAAHFSDGGDLTFTPEDTPEPPSWALLLLGGSSCFAAASRRRRNIRIPAL